MLDLSVAQPKGKVVGSIPRECIIWKENRVTF